MSSKYTSIRVTRETHNLLLTQGTVADSLDSVIKKLVLNQPTKKQEITS